MSRANFLSATLFPEPGSPSTINNRSFDLLMAESSSVMLFPRPRPVFTSTSASQWREVRHAPVGFVVYTFQVVHQSFHHAAHPFFKGRVGNVFVNGGFVFSHRGGVAREVVDEENGDQYKTSTGIDVALARVVANRVAASGEK